MVQIVEAVNEIYNIDKHTSKKLFLAGGITNCPDWQSEVIENLKTFDKLVIYNPRRKNFPINDPHASEEQITWEYEHLEAADIIVFWFSRGSLNPIVLYELGKWGNSTNKEIIIGLDPEYERQSDVIIQTRLSRPDVTIFRDMNSFIKAIKFKLLNYND